MVSYAEIAVWDVETGRRLHAYRVGAELEHLRAMAVSPDGRWLAAGEGAAIRAWSLETGEPLFSFTTDQPNINALAIASDGERIAAGGGTPLVKIWSRKTGAPLAVFEKESGRIMKLAFDPEDKRLAAVGQDGKLHIWSVATGELLTESRSYAGPTRDVEFTADGRYVFACGYYDVGRIDLAQLSHRQAERRHVLPSYAFDLAARQDGRRVAYTEYGGLGVTDVNSGRRLLPGTQREATAIAFDAEHRPLIFGWRNFLRDRHTLCLWSSEATSQPRFYAGATLTEMQTVSARGTRIAGRSADGSRWVVWDVAAGTEALSLKIPSDPAKERTKVVRAWALDAAGGRLAVGAPTGAVTVYGIDAQERLAAWETERGEVRTLVFGGERIVTHSRRGGIQVWDSTGALQHEFDVEGIAAWTVDENGRHLALAVAPSAAEGGQPSKPEIRVYRLSDGAQLGTFPLDAPCVDAKLAPRRTGSVTEPFRLLARYANPMALSPDGARLAYRTENGVVGVWSVERRRQAIEWKLPPYVAGIKFAPDGRHLLTINADATLYALRLPDAAP